MDKFIGKRLDGRYEFKELIGIGGMANVYRAFDIVENKDVAIKILKEEFLGNEEFVRRFRNESKAVATLSHPNIVRIFDVNFGDRIQYIVMELIDGITIKEYIEKKQKLSWKDTVHFTVQILRALQHAHDKGIVHRDIKPQNIMLLQDGTIKVMDFGIARFARDERRSHDKAIGSVHYISPEQASGGITDAKSDLYSVGVIMYEMLTGKLPFNGETPEEVAVKQMQATAVRPRQLDESIPEGLEEIIIRAMQKSPGKRYQSAAEMLRDIDEFKRDPSIVFEYKYFSEDDGSTKYFNTPNKADLLEGEDAKIVKDGKNNKKKKLIPILVGVSAAVVLVTVLLITLLLNLQSPAPVDVELQDFIGMKLEDVTSQEQYKDIKWDITEENNSEYEKGVIFKQDPQGGMSVKSNSKVKLTVSKGPGQITVPDVRNLPLQDAISKLKSAGLKNIQQVEQDNQEITANYVISTDPASGKQVASNTTITVYYSSGKGAQVDVPNVVGKTQADGTAALQALGLKVNVQQKDSTQSQGTIIEQSASGKVDAGSTVTIVVSTGSPGTQNVDISISLPAGSGVFQIGVLCNGSRIAGGTVSLSGSSQSFTFNDSGDNETKNYTVMIYDQNGNNGMQYMNLSVDYRQQPPKETIYSQDNTVFDKINKLNHSTSQIESAVSNG